MTTCRNIDICVLCYRFLEIFAYKYGSFSPKIVANFFCQNPFPAILRRKKKRKKKIPNVH